MSSTTYPGGKSGAGVYQRLINLIPRHRVLIAPFAGWCGVVRNIAPAEHTIVCDLDPAVCQWWDDWRRSPQGRDLEIHHCDGIEWMRHRFGLTEFSRPATRSTPSLAAASAAAASAECGGRPTHPGASRSSTHQPAAGPGETFVFCDPPYVMSERAHGKLYAYEMTDSDHRRLVGTVSRIPAAGDGAAIMVCGYPSKLYAELHLGRWRSIDHRVPTRGGLQSERIWLNYADPAYLHDYRYLGCCRRSRERIRRRQVSWREQLAAMPLRERQAMINSISMMQTQD